MKINQAYFFALLLCTFVGFFASCNNDKTKAQVSVSSPGNEEKAKPALKLAFVNGDTLNANYEFLKEKKASYEKKQTAFENEMASKQRQLQNEFETFQKKAQSGSLTQAEGESTQKRLAQQQQALEQRHQNMSAQLIKEQDAINTEFQSKLDAFLEKFNEEHKYDFIFTYSKAGGPILYADKAHDITQQVLKEMNADASSAPKTDTAKAK